MSTPVVITTTIIVVRPFPDAVWVAPALALEWGRLGGRARTLGETLVAGPAAR